ncbi:MAG: hypothetical protein VCB77_12015, partial [Alphaproteobacteria bacterium]
MAEKPPAIEPLSLAEIMAEGLDHRREGRAGQAEAAFQMVIAAAPRHAEALHQLGLLALDGGVPGSPPGCCAGRWISRRTATHPASVSAARSSLWAT